VSMCVCWPVCLCLYLYLCMYVTVCVFLCAGTVLGCGELAANHERRAAIGHHAHAECAAGRVVQGERAVNTVCRTDLPNTHRDSCTHTHTCTKTQGGTPTHPCVSGSSVRYRIHTHAQREAHTYTHTHTRSHTDRGTGTDTHTRARTDQEHVDGGGAVAKHAPVADDGCLGQARGARGIDISKHIIHARAVQHLGRGWAARRCRHRCVHVHAHRRRCFRRHRSCTREGTQTRGGLSTALSRGSTQARVL
jgi:hypothetical protein